MQVKQELVVDEVGSLGAAMTIIDSNVRPQPRGNDLALVLQRRIGLHHGYREVAGGMPLQVRGPHEPIPVAAAAAAPAAQSEEVPPHS